MGCRVLSDGLCAACEFECNFVSLQSRILDTPIFSSMRYNSITSHILLASKEDGVREADDFLLRALQHSFRGISMAAENRISIVPVPSARRATRKRGRNFMFEIATRLGKTEGIPVLDLLRHTRRIADQSGLAASARERNISGVMSVKTPVKRPRNVILLDDLVTTGATLNEAVRALGKERILVVGAITAFLALPIR